MLHRQPTHPKVRTEELQKATRLQLYQSHEQRQTLVQAKVKKKCAKVVSVRMHAAMRPPLTVPITQNTYLAETCFPQLEAQNSRSFTLTPSPFFSVGTRQSQAVLEDPKHKDNNTAEIMLEDSESVFILRTPAMYSNYVQATTH